MNLNLNQSLKKALPHWLPRLAFAPQGQAPRGDVLICVFQRGGMDGLNAVVPLGDSDYFRARPTLSIQAPKAGDATTAIALDRELCEDRALHFARWREHF